MVIWMLFQKFGATRPHASPKLPKYRLRGKSHIAAIETSVNGFIPLTTRTYIGIR